MCGKHLKPVVMELGGAAPFIVLQDADIEHAVNNAVHGSFFHSGRCYTSYAAHLFLMLPFLGQICMSTK